MRIEKDCIGEMFVPDEALYGIHSLRAQHNFPITEERVNPAILKSYLQIKKAAALTNQAAGTLNKEKAAYIVSACNQLLFSNDFEPFIVPAIQGGAGTSTNMNVNEVVAHLAMKISAQGGKTALDIHPNDDVNQSQSTNDSYPTAGKMAMLKLLPGLQTMVADLVDALMVKSSEYEKAIKVGRTQLQDAVPTTYGRTFKAYASMFKRDLARLKHVEVVLSNVNLGGTAIGTGINTTPEYQANIVPTLNQVAHLSLKQADDLVDETQNSDAFVAFSGVMKGLAVNLSKFSNDLRLLSSGPQAGLNELSLPKQQAGSSIMPGKVNPVIPEVVVQVAYEVIGNDVTVTMAAENGELELNAFEPIMFRDILMSEQHLTNAIETLVDNCVKGIKVNVDYCRSEVEHSSIAATILSPLLGYEKTTALIKKAVATHESVKRIVEGERLLPTALVEELFSPEVLTNAKRVNLPEVGAIEQSSAR
ncbi:aspartate ammonia-lyase [Lentilactobacillus diolivorans]|uniref:Aspartate ammonia-lyase n=2 Tax=Lentilactobacillus diolivorans TaxID=179838 RepID=A0A0R1S2P6_9LACO|nr:aspartate ammonia-lyase [Lentilactobacillus diolivorans]KRL63233.1 aspartate ammonia-lyase [Lentilactobacillus diolivorans DSM 14421]GEP24527.1 aspartate ammonia-lyase [Lentilactobacillus diolivorans]